MWEQSVKVNIYSAVYISEYTGSPPSKINNILKKKIVLIIIIIISLHTKLILRVLRRTNVFHSTQCISSRNLVCEETFFFLKFKRSFLYCHLLIFIWKWLPVTSLCNSIVVNQNIFWISTLYLCLFSIYS